jgi:hypothetical protein
MLYITTCCLPVSETRRDATFAPRPMTSAVMTSAKTLIIRLLTLRYGLSVAHRIWEGFIDLFVNRRLLFKLLISDSEVLGKMHSLSSVDH